MCRSIKTLFNFSPPVSGEEIRAASLQFVRKISGFQSPSRVNQAAFERATEDVTRASRRLMNALKTTAAPRDRAQAAAAARARWKKRNKVR
jgi:hypothetical protein